MQCKDINVLKEIAPHANCTYIFYIANLSLSNNSIVSQVLGELVNTGHSLEWRKIAPFADHRASNTVGRSSLLSSGEAAAGDVGAMFRDRGGGSVSVNVSGGPLSYQYSLTVARLHYGERDLQGSEHTIGNHAFPAEVSKHIHL